MATKIPKKRGMAMAKIRAAEDARTGKSIDNVPYKDRRWRKCYREAFMRVSQLALNFF